MYSLTDDGPHCEISELEFKKLNAAYKHSSVKINADIRISQSNHFITIYFLLLYQYLFQQVPLLAQQKK